MTKEECIRFYMKIIEAGREVEKIQKGLSTILGADIEIFDCIHDKLCDMWAVESGLPFVNPNTCEHFKNKADFVEVVRCGKCKHRGWVQEPCHGKTVDFCRKHSMCIYNTDFCSYGERSDT